MLGKDEWGQAFSLEEHINMKGNKLNRQISII